MNIERYLLSRFACALILASAFTLPTQAQVKEKAQHQDKPCIECHAALMQKMLVHKDCADCHAALDASVVPHTSKGKSAKERAAEGPALCLNCHDAKLFKGKVGHAPVEDGKCLECHDSHASDYPGLLKKEPATLCLDCHPDIAKGPHVIAGFTRSGHPLGNDKQEAPDPLRPGKKFYCVACHEPHRSERPKLNRFEKGMVTCLKCHPK